MAAANKPSPPAREVNRWTTTTAVLIMFSFRRCRWPCSSFSYARNAVHAGRNAKYQHPETRPLNILFDPKICRGIYILKLSLCFFTGIALVKVHLFIGQLPSDGRSDTCCHQTAFYFEIYTTFSRFSLLWPPYRTWDRCTTSSCLSVPFSQVLGILYLLPPWSGEPFTHRKILHYIQYV